MMDRLALQMSENQRLLRDRLGKDCLAWQLVEAGAGLSEAELKSTLKALLVERIRKRKEQLKPRVLETEENEVQEDSN